MYVHMYVQEDGQSMRNIPDKYNISKYNISNNQKDSLYKYFHFQKYKAL